MDVKQDSTNQPPSPRVQELCESRGGRPVLPVSNIKLAVSVDVKQHSTNLRWCSYMSTLQKRVHSHRLGGRSNSPARTDHECIVTDWVAVATDHECIYARTDHECIYSYRLGGRSNSPVRTDHECIDARTDHECIYSYRLGGRSNSPVRTDHECIVTDWVAEATHLHELTTSA